MNTKKNKNKNRSNKPPNPAPPQALEKDVAAASEKSESCPLSPVVEKPEIMLKPEERVPEILNQNKAVSEVKDETENDSPKKPKRNRGKKKKIEKEEGVTIEGEGTQEWSDIKDDKKTAVQETESDAQNPVVAVTNRKKKGKNKTSEAPETDKISQEDVMKPVESKIDTVSPECEVSMEMFSGTIEQENIQTKKKNKKNKKNRTDSERSDKIDELSCTAAFKKILVQKDETDIALKDTLSKEETKDSTVSDSSISEPTIKEIKKTFEEPAVIKESDNSVSDDTQKSKKRNKKDKKHQQREEYLHDIKIIELEVVTVQDDKPLESTFVVEDQPSQYKGTELTGTESATIQSKSDNTSEKESTVVKDASPKPKAKIAKPVEKKGKAKPIASVEVESDNTDTFRNITEAEKLVDNQSYSQENAEVITNISISTESARPPQSIFKPNVLELEIKSPTFDDSSIEVAKQSSLEEKKLEEDEFISTGSKASYFEEANAQQEKEKEKTNLSEKNPNTTDIKETIAVERNKLFDTPTTQEIYKTTSDIPIIGESLKEEETLQQSINLIPEAMAEGIISDSTVLPPAENIKVPDNAMGKKRKKSPKPIKKSELPVLQENIRLDDDIMILPITEDITQDSKDKLTQEIDSIGAVTEEKMSYSKQENTPSSTSELTPDLIEYPRSTSAQLLDGNNNTVIREINTPDTSLFVPIVMPNTPLIQGSGETPTPDVIAAGVKCTKERKTESPRDSLEKTDLKSKVMEVNKDMEELRLSIERSLAEFTQLEKEDKNLDKKLDTPTGSIEKLDDPVKDQVTHEFTKIPLQDIPFVTENVKSQDKKDHVTEITDENVQLEITKEQITALADPPTCPARKDNKGKGKSKKRGKQEHPQQTVSIPTQGVLAVSATESTYISQETKKEGNSEEKSNTKSEPEQKKDKQQADSTEDNKTSKLKSEENTNAPEKLCDSSEFGPIDNFEDAMTSSADDVNKTFEIIADEVMHDNILEQTAKFPDNPQINITEPDDTDKSKEEKQQRTNPLVSQPKNLLGHPEIPARSNKTDYKKEKNKPLNTKLARVKIKDSVEIDKETKGTKHSKECQTENKPKSLKNKSVHESVTCVTSENDEYIYKYSFRKVFLPSNCNVCKKELKSLRVPCSFCNLVFYCSQKHKDEDYPQHQALCFAVSTIGHLKGQKHIYADAQGVTGHNYRLLRMQMIVSSEKILKRKLAAWEQEALLYPRMCAEPGCREWKQGKLIDCELCGQVSFCKEHPDHLPKSHARWCKSYCLYHKLVVHQLTKGRLEPKLPGRQFGCDRISDNINRLLADMYDEKIDMTDMQYAALTQLATAPLTAAYCYQLYHDKMKSVSSNGVHKNTIFTIHVVGAELQFEADTLNKWETFFLHLKPDVQELRVVLVGPELNPSNLPLDLLGKIKLCPTCRVDKRRVSFGFRDKQLYHEYVVDDDFLKPDIVCAFNPSINRSSSYNDTWSSAITSIFKLKVPFVITSYTMNELQRDLATIKNSAKLDFHVVSEAKYNPFASVRPDRNFITDDEIPLLFKNYCYMVLIGAF